MLDFKTAGESHGRGLLVIIEGVPAGIEISKEEINEKLLRRQGGYGRGGRMKIESDQVEIYSGIRGGLTTGSPVGFLINNKDWENWQQVMSPDKDKIIEKEKLVIKRDEKIKEISPRVTRPRPGHADLAGVYKYNLADIRNILERASARETTARTAAGALLEKVLSYFNIEIISHVLQLGPVKSSSPEVPFDQLKEKVVDSPLHCFDKDKENEMISYIDKIQEEGDTAGGVVEIITTPLPVGLGTHVSWQEKLDGKLAAALMSIQAIKGVEFGPAFDNAARKGSEVHDEIFYDGNEGFYRKTNRAGGLEGGITNGQPLQARIAMKPLSTLYQPLQSVDIASKKPFAAQVERSDVTAVPAAGVVAEAMVAFVLARALLEKFGGDHLEEVIRNYKNYLKQFPGGQQ